MPRTLIAHNSAALARASGWSSTQANGLHSRLVGRSSGRAAHPGSRWRSPRDRSPGIGDFSLGPRRVRQHVIADGSLHPRSNAAYPRPTPVGGAGVRPGARSRGALAGVSRFCDVIGTIASRLRGGARLSVPAGIEPSAGGRSPRLPKCPLNRLRMRSIAGTYGRARTQYSSAPEKSRRRNHVKP